MTKKCYFRLKPSWKVFTLRATNKIPRVYGWGHTITHGHNDTRTHAGIATGGNRVWCTEFLTHQRRRLTGKRKVSPSDWLSRMAGKEVGHSDRERKGDAPSQYIAYSVLIEVRIRFHSIQSSIDFLWGSSRVPLAMTDWFHFLYATYLVPGKTTTQKSKRF